MNTPEKNQMPKHVDEKWKSQYVEAKNVLGDLQKQLEKIYPAGQVLIKRHEIYRECERSLGKSGKELRSYSAWHLLIGSTTDREMSPDFDLSGENTIINFIQKKIEELQNIKT
jgi:hypothetical protein